MDKDEHLYSLAHFLIFITDDPDVEKAMEVERNQMRGEFLRIMQERFLAGDDKDFDYRFAIFLFLIFISLIYCLRG